MAKKDWEQTGENEWERDDRNLKIIEGHMFLTSKQRERGERPERFGVLVNSHSGGKRFPVNGDLNGGNFKSLAKAKAVAMRYMRTH